MRKLNNLEPSRVFYYFEEITKIPRCSLKEDKIANYLEDFAKEHNLEYVRDEFNNIIIKKPGTSGFEKSKGLIIQGHMDMVCEKEESYNFDFDNDPIKFSVEKDLIVSHHTTLGADNGIAVAMILAILESNEIQHPPIEALITSNEENGMTGASNLDGTLLNSEMLLNLDSESEGIACVGCATGERDIIILDKEFKEIKNKEFYELSISGLKGGHSGQDIDKGLGNANKLLARSLKIISEKVKLDLIDIRGGAKPNAIPRFSKAIIGINLKDLKYIQDEVVILNRNFVKEFGKVDPDIRLNFEKVNEEYNKSFTEKLKNNLINILNILPNGIQSMSHDIEGLVGASVNVGVVESNKDNITIHSAVRASSESLRKEIALRNEICANLCKGEYKVLSSYPAWEYKENSPLRDVASKVYKELNGKDLELEVIHAGLECGILTQRIGDIDMMSIGPNIHGPHAPGESLEIKSTKRVYDFLLELLKNLK
ncbi:MAG: aminoacyl-histidine dipeptidase [Peptoniphilaceae bacterium]